MERLEQAAAVFQALALRGKEATKIEARKLQVGLVCGRLRVCVFVCLCVCSMCGCGCVSFLCARWPQR